MYVELMAEKVASVISQVVGILQNVFDPKEAREKFTNDSVDRLAQEFPDYNVLLVHTAHHFESGEHVHKHVEFYTGAGNSYGYEVYLMRKGQKTVFILDGDGGFINWCFTGSYNRDGHRVEFN
jgi:hypothetical protein